MYLIFQIAQDLYDESDDHFSRMKSAEDQAAKAFFLEAAKGFKDIDPNDDKQIRHMIDEISEKIKSTNCTYFENALNV